MSNKINIGMVQINNSFSNQNYLPYSIGIFQAFVRKYAVNASDLSFLSPIYKRVSVDYAVETLLPADIIFFSVYVWNKKISLEISRRIKAIKPQVLIVFGGPSVPKKNIDEFLLLNPCIDLACHGEGELIIRSIVENYAASDWQKVPSISFIDKHAGIISNPACERISELDIIPSPYLSGVFEPLIKAHPEEEWIVLWETNRGCPFSCVYCDWGSAVKNKVYAYDIERIFQEIDWFARNRIEFVFCCDANFGILPRDIRIVEYLAEAKREYGYPKAFSVQNTKNSSERTYNIYKIMAAAGLNKGISLSLQSLNDETLKAIKRQNISSKVFKELQEKFTADKVETFTDIILGLPSETYESFVSGICSIIENGQHNRIQFNNLSILPNAVTADPQYQQEFGFNIVETKIINIHGRLSGGDEVFETQQLVVGTHTMPKPDWVKARSFAWMVALLYFDKLLQIPFLILHKKCALGFRELVGLFVDAQIESPVISAIYSFFVNKALDIQNGGTEYCESREWLGIWWPADELILIRLCAENKLAAFYDESIYRLEKLLAEKKLYGYFSIVQQAVSLNKNLLKTPFDNENFNVQLSYNIWDVYQALLKGDDLRVEKGDFLYQVDRSMNIACQGFDDWCREVVWYGNKKGAYLYPCREAHPQIK